MNEELTGGVTVAALKGRVPVKVSGEVKKGDLLVTADELGCATSRADQMMYHPQQWLVLPLRIQRWDGQRLKYNDDVHWRHWHNS